jgi:tRNA(fMet)-specific endonuclease VapC
MRFLLDTDTCIEVIRGREPAASRLRGMSPDDLVISAMTVAELHFGALNSSDPERSLRAVEAFLSAPIEIAPFDEEAARRHATIRLALRARPIGERDLIIAATARSHDWAVVTGNRRHFDRVAGLQVLDWGTKEPGV